MSAIKEKICTFSQQLRDVPKKEFHRQGGEGGRCSAVTSPFSSALQADKIFGTDTLNTEQRSGTDGLVFPAL